VCGTACQPAHTRKQNVVALRGFFPTFKLNISLVGAFYNRSDHLGLFICEEPPWVFYYPATSRLRVVCPPSRLAGLFTFLETAWLAGLFTFFETTSRRSQLFDFVGLFSNLKWTTTMSTFLRLRPAPPTA